MAIQKGESVWEGPYPEGKGAMTIQSGEFYGEFSEGTRQGTETGTSPEELLGAAHAGCFSMALAARLSKHGYHPQRIHTIASVYFDEHEHGTISKIHLEAEAVVPGLGKRAFQQHVHTAIKTCPLSRALSNVPIDLEARLVI